MVGEQSGGLYMVGGEDGGPYMVGRTEFCMEHVYNVWLVERWLPEKAPELPLIKIVPKREPKKEWGTGRLK
jgi:hypothetical protein